MKRFFALIPLLVFSLFAKAQLNGDGFYRVQNYGSQRYAYVCDRTGYINYTTQNADVGALQLWSDKNRTYDDPGSVVYIRKISDNQYDLQSQGTGLYEIISHYVEIYEKSSNRFEVYATQNGMAKYLGDQTTDTTLPMGNPGFNANGMFRQWSVFPINTTDNYIGITPTVHVGGKHYQPYYVSFAFKKVSSGMKVYYIKKVDNEFGIAVIEELTSEIIPAATPVIVECPSTSASGNKIQPIMTSASTVSGNQLGGVYFCNPLRASAYTGTEFNATTMRTLCARSDGKLGFTNAPANLTQVTLADQKKHGCLPQNSSYLKVQSNTPAQLQIMNQTDYNAYVEAHATHLATSVTLNQTTASLFPGQTVTLTATVLPENTTNKAVTWKSSNTAVATVENGVVTAKGVGSATITVTTADGSNKTATCVVTVNPVMATSVSLNKTAATLQLGETVTLTATVLPENATNKAVTWKSSNTAVATVENGVVTAKSIGTATITVTTADGSNKTATCAITVTPVYATSVTLNITSTTMTPGQTLTLVATVHPDNTTNKGVTWASSNTDVATVDDSGHVTVTGIGTANITVTTVDGSNKTATCAITVNPILATSVKLNETECTLKVGSTRLLIPTVSPKTATNKNVSWTSSNTDVAIVDNEGLVTAVGEGFATITATTVDGSNKSASCAVTVVPVKATSIYLDKSKAQILLGETTTLTATIYPSNTTEKTVAWTSSNETVATVDAEGNVTGVGLGTATIYAKTTDGTDLSATCKITVNPVLAESISLNRTLIQAVDGEHVQLEATILPENTTNARVEWSTNNEEVATVDENGLVTIHTLGSAVISAKTTDGTDLVAKCNVTSHGTLAESITLNYDEQEVFVGESFTLKAAILPYNASTRTVTWSSSNTDIAIVSTAGLVETLAPGEVSIIATTTDGTNISATCHVKVKPVLVESITVTPTSLALTDTETWCQLEVTVLPENATYPQVRYSSSDDNVASVSGTGLVTYVGEGTATIFVDATDGSECQAVCLVNCVSGIITIMAPEQGARYYTPAGEAISKPRRGLNIVILEDGTIKKILIK